MIPTWRGPPPPTNMPQWQGMPPQGGPPFYWQNQGSMMGQQIPPNFNLTPQNNSNKEVSNASNVEDQKLMSLQMQAQQWQQQKQMQEWLNQNNPQMTNTNLSVALTPEQIKTKNDKTQELEAIKKEEEEFDKQYREWEKQFDQWKEQNKNHPNKEQFKQYEEQWSQWKAQMNGKKAEILGKKEAVEKVLAQLNAQTAQPPLASNMTPLTPYLPPNNAMGSSNPNPAQQFMYGCQPGAPLPPQSMGMNNFAGPGPVAGMMPSGQLGGPMGGQSNYQHSQPSYNDNNANNMMMMRGGQGQQRPPTMLAGGQYPNEYSSNYGVPYSNFQSQANNEDSNSANFKPQNNYESNEDQYDSNNDSYDNPNPVYNASGMGSYGSGYNAQGSGLLPFNSNNNNNSMGGMNRPPLPTPSLSTSPHKVFNPFPTNNNNKVVVPTFQPTGQFTYGASLSTLNSSNSDVAGGGGGERKKGTRWSQPIRNSGGDNEHNDDFDNNGTQGAEEPFGNGDEGYRDLNAPDNAPTFRASYPSNYPPSMGGSRPTGQTQDGGDGFGSGGMGGSGPPSDFLPPRPPFNPAAAAMMMMMRLRGAAGPPRFPPRGGPMGGGPRGGGGPFFNRPNFPGAGPPFGRRPFPNPRAGGPDPPRSRSRSPTSRSHSGKNSNSGYGHDNYRGGGGGGGMMSMPPYKVGPRPPFRPGQQPRFNSNNSFQGGRPRHMQQNFGYQGPGHVMGDQKTNNLESEQTPSFYHNDNESIAHLNQFEPESYNELDAAIRCCAIDEILVKPLPKTFIVLRGLPGAGKSYVAKIIKELAVSRGLTTPKILSLDDYFITEVEKVGSKAMDSSKTTIMEYKFEAELLHSYVESLGKSVRKQLESGSYDLLIMDSLNNLVSQFEPLTYRALQCGYRVYVGEVEASPEIAFERNIHDRTLEEIATLSKCWQPCPPHFNRLDIESLLVEKETPISVGDQSLKKVEKLEEKIKKDVEDKDEPISGGGLSRWELEQSEENLSKLDGMSVKRKANLHNKLTMEDYLQLPDDYDTRAVKPGDGKKRVRWADVEERKDQEKKRAMGFVMGQTDWKKMVDDQHAEKALNRTKYI